MPNRKSKAMLFNIQFIRTESFDLVLFFYNQVCFGFSVRCDIIITNKDERKAKNEK